MGVVTTTDVDYGQIFGPFPTHLSATDPSYVIGLLTNDKHPDGSVLRVDINEPPEGMSPIDWMPHVAPARDEEEQNMEAYLKDGNLYYRTLRIVKAEEEMLVWYSKDFSKILGVPELQTNSKRDDEQFICSHCGEMFDFPYPLRAHLKFKCSFTIDETIPKLSPLSHRIPQKNGHNIYTNSSVFKGSNGIEGKPHNSLNYITNNNSMFIISSKRPTREIDSGSPPKKMKLGTENGQVKKESRLISHSIEELTKSCRSSNNSQRETGLDSHSDNASAFRKVEKSLSPDRKEPLSPLGSPNAFSTSSSSSRQMSPQSPYSPTGCGVLPFSSTVPGPHNLSVHESNSHRISPRHHLASPSSPAMTQSSTSTMPPPPLPPQHRQMHQFPHPSSMKIPSSVSQSEQSSSSLSTSSATSVAVAAAAAAAAAGPLMGLYMPNRLPMLSPPSGSSFGMSGGSMLGTSGSSVGRSLPQPHSAFPDQIPPGLLEMCRATIPTVGPLTESFAANIRNGGVYDTLAKQALFADRHISSLSFLKSTNPMVEKLLQSTNPTVLTSPINALNLSQNWCAKCNATFRMTSDLVYHMRSHHKREFDPMKRKREEKLKCTICNEAFRERHHLTRHMSSHA